MSNDDSSPDPIQPYPSSAYKQIPSQHLYIHTSVVEFAVIELQSAFQITVLRQATGLNHPSKKNTFHSIVQTHTLDRDDAT